MAQVHPPAEAEGRAAQETEGAAPNQPVHPGPRQADRWVHTNGLIKLDIGILGQ